MTAELHALARQIARRPLLPRQDRSRRQDAQPQQRGEVLRIGVVAAVLQSFVLLDRRRVGEMHMVASILQSVDQPIPVVGRLDHHAGQFVLPPSQKANDLRDIVGQPLLRHNPITIVDHSDNAVVVMYSGIDLHSSNSL